MATSFEHLDVYRLACRLGDETWRCAAVWPTAARDTMGRQLTRAADSVAANIAEGDCRGSQADFRRFLYIARGSLYETTHWVRTATRRGLLSSPDAALLDDLLDELLPRLNALIRTVKHRIEVTLREPESTYETPSASDSQYCPTRPK